MNRLKEFTCFLLFVLSFLKFSSIYGNSSPAYYEVQKNKSRTQAIDYNRTQQSASRYLAFRDIPSFIRKYVIGQTALDFGAGTGISTLFLRDLGFNVTGVDISPEMLNQGRILCPAVPFHLLQEGIIPAKADSFDLVFSGWVLFELGTKEKIISYLEEAKRVLNQKGKFIAVTGSQEMFSRNWLIYDTNFPENKILNSGQLHKVYSYDVGIEFTDYYWSEADYISFFSEAGFNLLEIHYPLGREDEDYAWRDEKKYSPYVIFIAEKNS